jgi:hypothetical protein
MRWSGTHLLLLALSPEHTRVTAREATQEEPVETGEGPRPDQENFGEATLGEAQSSDPPADPEMLDDPEAQDDADELEDDPAYNPEDPDLKRIKGG